MADLREFHARFKKLENEFQSPQFSSTQLPYKIRALGKLLKESQLLDQRFLRINKGFLYEKALVEDAAARTKKLRKLYDCLTRAGRKSTKAQRVPTLRTRQRWHWAANTKGAIKEPPQVPFPLGAAE